MKIAIVNDMPLAVEALKRAIRLEPAHEIVWVAGNGADAVAKCAQQRPDLMLMDMIMPVMDGVEATQQIMAATPCPILVVTASIDSNVTKVYQAMGHGALDAVNTPELGLQVSKESAAPLLNKIWTIGRLHGGMRPARKRAPAPAPVVAPSSMNGTRLLAIGSSAGGPGALQVVLSGLPGDFPAAVVLVQHVDEKFAPGMAEWLGRSCALPVRLAVKGDVPKPGTVLIAGSNDHLALDAGGQLFYTPEPVDDVYRPSVDVFFQSARQHWRGAVVAVLLTGMGDDGAEGLKRLRERGCHTIAQDEATSAVYGMPKAAAAIGAAVEILPLPRIAGRVQELFR